MSLLKKPYFLLKKYYQVVISKDWARTEMLFYKVPVILYLSCTRSTGVSTLSGMYGKNTVVLRSNTGDTIITHSNHEKYKLAEYY
jgi:hypothetical protein